MGQRDKENRIETTISNSWELEVFYDGDCPLCRREIEFLRRRDRGGRIRFTNISATTFEASAYGKTQDEFMERIHGLLPDGFWVAGVEVFRRLYDAIGFRPLVFLTRLPLISHALDFGYRVFAANRLKWTGRCSAQNPTCSVRGRC